MFATIIIPAILVVIGRLFVSDSPHWLISRGRTADAEKAATQLLKRVPQYPKTISLAHLENEHEQHAGKTGYAALFSRRNRRATVLASVPWFLQDLSTYGIGIFTPTILAVVLGAQSTSHDVSATIQNDILGAKGSALTNILFIVGIIVAIFLVERVGRIKLQIFGFIGCGVGLLLAAFSIRADGSNNLILLFIGFPLFYFMTNLGPNAMTYLLAGEVFPTPVRGKGAGFAASFAKVGAVLTAFLFPILLEAIGTAPVLYFLVGTCVVGAIVTFLFRIETKGVNLEDIGRSEVPE
jgi:MFS family permease